MLRLFAVSKVESLLSSVFFPVLFVGSLYIWGKSVFLLGRNHPESIKRRIISVTLVCIISTFYLTLWARKDVEWSEFFAWLGVRSEGFLPALVLPLLLTMILFAGPLTLSYYAGELSPSLLWNDLKLDVRDLAWWRNYIVGPIAEEWVFRACICPLLLCGGFSFGGTVISSPLLFGLAHAHHFFESVFVKNVPVARAAIETVFQLFYTTVFGVYSAFLFIRTGQVIAPIIAHTFCNLMGFPAFDLIPGHEKKPIVILAFVVGLGAFFLLLHPLTDPQIYQSFLAISFA